jgi:hypothetical protein
MIRKFDDHPEVPQEILEEKDHLGLAEKELLDGAAQHRAKAREYHRRADDLERKAKMLRESSSAETPSGPAKIADWANTTPADAMKEYFLQFATGQHVKISQIVKDLERGGCKVAGKLRPKGDKSPQAAAERKIVQIASHNKDLYGLNREVREVWKV